MISSASSFVTNVISLTLESLSSCRRTRLTCLFATSPLSQVLSVQKKILTCTSFLTAFDQDTTHVPSAIASPSRNIPISTVMVAANVVERLARIDRSASATRS
jgi:hypothetical protein